MIDEEKTKQIIKYSINNKDCRELIKFFIELSDVENITYSYKDTEKMYFNNGKRFMGTLLKHYFIQLDLLKEYHALVREIHDENNINKYGG